MDEKSHNLNYKLALGDVKFSVEIDDSLSAAIRNKNTVVEEKNLHYHPMHELFFVFDEPLQIVTENEILEYSNCVVCIPPFVKHFSRRSGDFRLLFSFKAAEHSVSPLSEFFKKTFDLNKISSVCGMKREIKVYADELANLFYRHEGELCNELSVSVLKLLLHHIYDYSTVLKKRAIAPQKESYYLIISRSIASSSTPGVELNLSAMSQKLHLSEKQTSRIVKKYFGKSLSAVVLEEKLNAAAHMLLTTNLPISEISLLSNFRCENYFHIQFKKQYHCTPREYRILYKQRDRLI